MRTRFDIYPATGPVVYSSGELPAYDEYFHLPASEHLMARGDNGSVYSQASQCNPHYDFFHVSIEIFEETAIEMKVAETVHVVEYTITGNAEFKTAGGGIRAMLKNTYCVMQLPAALYKAVLAPGRYSIFYLILSKDQLEGLSKAHIPATGAGEKKESESCRSKRMVITAPVWEVFDKITGNLKKGFGLGMELAGCMMQLLSVLYEDLTSAGSEKAIQQSADFVARVDNFIIRYLADRGKTTVKTLAAAFNMSESSFKRKFSFHFSKPVHKYILARRIEMARVLLSRGNITLQDVAEKVGYSDAFALSRQLKKYNP